MIGCENNDKEWRLTCVETTWVGEIGNCSGMGKYVFLVVFIFLVVVCVVAVVVIA